MIANPRTPEHSITDDADVVVVGTGAGGGAFAGEFAGRGKSVVLLEEGGYVDPDEYNGDPVAMTMRLYRAKGMTATVGRPGIALPLGCTVGGTTVINSGTAYPPPERVLLRWRREQGLLAKDLSPEGLLPYVERVERALSVSEVPEEYIGESARIIRRGFGSLGISGHPLRRAQRNCRGTGLCCFGCPRNAKQTTLLTYLPRAVAAGARLYASCRVDQILSEKGRVAGVSGVLLHPVTREPTPHRITVRARVVIMAGGAIGTPVTLRRAKVGSASGLLGRGLRLHPAAKVFAEMDGIVDGFHGVPQSYGSEDFAEEGFVLEGIFVPPALTALALPGFGREHQELLERYRQLASFGLMVIDEGQGRVKLDLFGDPLISYRMARRDVAAMHRGLALLCRAFLLAGAKRVIPFVRGFPMLRSLAEVEAFESAPVRGTDIEIMGFHPMGTARLGPNPAYAVVDENLQMHGVPGLYICDASVFPTALGVNPQVTIMSLAARLADHLHDQSQMFRA